MFFKKFYYLKWNNIACLIPYQFLTGSKWEKIILSTNKYLSDKSFKQSWIKTHNKNMYVPYILKMLKFQDKIFEFCNRTLKY